MTAGAMAVEALLAIGVLTALVCCLGVAVMRNHYERLHFMAPISTVSVTAILAAVVVQEGWGQAAIKMSLILLALVFTNAVLAHATARAARMRELGQWRPAEDERIAGLDQVVGKRRNRK